MRRTRFRDSRYDLSPGAHLKPAQEAVDAATRMTDALRLAVRLDRKLGDQTVFEGNEVHRMIKQYTEVAGLFIDHIETHSARFPDLRRIARTANSHLDPDWLEMIDPGRYIDEKFVDRRYRKVLHDISVQIMEAVEHARDLQDALDELEG